MNIFPDLNKQEATNIFPDDIPMCQQIQITIKRKDSFPQRLCMGIILLQSAEF